MYKLYMLIKDEDYSTPHYFGITKSELTSRLRGHIAASKQPTINKRGKKKPYVSCWIKKVYDRGSSIQIVELVNNLSLRGAQLLETSYIKIYKDVYPLKNTSSGGETNENSNHPTIPVDQYTLDGKFIKTFHSAAEVQRVFGERVKVTEVCKGQLVYSKGYVWRYHGEPFNKYKTIPNVGMYAKEWYLLFDLEGNLLKKILGQTEMAKELSMNQGSINHAANNPFLDNGYPRITKDSFFLIKETNIEGIKRFKEILNTDWYNKKTGRKTCIPRSKCVNFNKYLLIHKTLCYVEFKGERELKEHFYAKYGEGVNQLSVVIKKRGMLKGWYFFEIGGDNTQKRQSWRYYIDLKNKSIGLLKELLKDKYKTYNIYSSAKPEKAKQLLQSFSLIEIDNDVEDIVRTIGKPMSISEFHNQEF